VNVLVLDETLELSAPVRELANLHGWQPHFVGSLHEVELAVQAHGRPALLVVNLQPPLTGWELGQRLRGLGLESPVVVLGARGHEGEAAALPGVQWLERPVGEAELGAALEQVVSRLGLGARGASRGGGGRGAGEDREGGARGRERVHIGGVGDGQGADRAGDPHAERAVGSAAGDAGLHGDPGGADGEPSLWARAGQLHGGGGAPDGVFCVGAHGDAVHRRDQ